MSETTATDWGDVSLMLTGSRDSSYDSVMDALRYRIDREGYIRELESQLNIEASKRDDLQSQLHSHEENAELARVYAEDIIPKWREQVASLTEENERLTEKMKQPGWRHKREHELEDALSEAEQRAAHAENALQELGIILDPGSAEEFQDAMERIEAADSYRRKALGQALSPIDPPLGQETEQQFDDPMEPGWEQH